MGTAMGTNGNIAFQIVNSSSVKGNQLDRWYDDNAEAISFGQFYRENFPKQYREWHTVQWQRDIALRDSICRAHSLDHLKRLYEAGE